jgi:hypothetical protein
MTILSGGINYATYPILIDKLSLSAFAEFSVFANLITIFAIHALRFGYYILIRTRRSPDDIRSDRLSNRDDRFHIPKKHMENIAWLDSQDKYIKKVFSNGSLALYEILNFDTNQFTKIPKVYTIKK